jgi:hypothetical protein
MIREWLFLYRHKRACKRLQRIVEAQRLSFEAEQYRRRRVAALKATRGPTQADYHAGAAW